MYYDSLNSKTDDHKILVASSLKNEFQANYPMNKNNNNINNLHIKIGEIDKYGNFVITYDIARLKKNAEKIYMETTGKSIEFTDFSIKKGFDSGYQSTIYYLLISNRSNTNRNIFYVLEYKRS